MDEKALFTDFWTKESKTTRNVLARIPEGSDYRPDAKSRTAQEIAWQIVCEERMIIEALESGKAEWAPPPAAGHDEGRARRVRKAERRDGRALEGPAGRAVGRHAGILRPRAPRFADGLELSLRHRAPPRTDFDVPAADGIDRAADLRPERGRTIDRSWGPSSFR